MGLALPGLAVIKIRDALLDAYPDRESIDELFLRVDRSFAALQPYGLSLNGALLSVLTSASEKGWLAKLLIAAADQAPTDANLAQLRDAYAQSGPGPDGGTRHSCRLSGGYYLVDRAEMWTTLEALSDALGKRILLITGDRKTGKSYSKLLIRHRHDRDRLPTPAEIDLEEQTRLLPPQDKGLTPEHVARTLVRELRYADLPVPPAPNDKQWAKWTEQFCSDFEYRALDDPDQRWVVFDAFHIDPSSDVLDLIKGLALRVGGRLSRFRLVLVGFPGQLPGNITGTVHPERPGPIGAVEVSQFAADFYDETESSLDYDTRRLRGATFVRTVLEGLTPGEPGYLAAINERVSTHVSILTEP